MDIRCVGRKTTKPAVSAFRIKMKIIYIYINFCFYHYHCLLANHTFLNYRFEDVLKNGVVLCRLMNKIQPNSIKRIKESGTAFQLMENIQAYVSMVLMMS